MHGYELLYEGADSPRGKVWCVRTMADGSGVRIDYGARGARLRSIVVPIGRCREQSCCAEMEHRTARKVAEGYAVVRADLEPVGPKVADGEEQTEPRPDNPRVLAHAALASVRQARRAEIDSRLAAHLASVCERACVPGTHAVEATETGFSVTGRFRGAGVAEALGIPTTLGWTVRQNQRTLGLLTASLAQAFPATVRLANNTGDEISPRELAAAIEADRRVLEQFGIVRMIRMGEAQPLGQWFF